jgi:hypothetical protein
MKKDPTGTGKGGNSIWDKKFDDEYNDLTHYKRGKFIKN